MPTPPHFFGDNIPGEMSSTVTFDPDLSGDLLSSKYWTQSSNIMSSITIPTTQTPTWIFSKSAVIQEPDNALKDGLMIVIIDENKIGWELCEHQTMTPKEMFGLMKMYTAIQLTVGIANAGGTSKIFNWMQMMVSEGIERFFVEGEHEDWYFKNVDSYSSALLILK